MGLLELNGVIRIVFVEIDEVDAVEFDIFDSISGSHTLPHLYIRVSGQLSHVLLGSDVQP
jgi:hypothetical protein